MYTGKNSLEPLQKAYPPDAGIPINPIVTPEEIRNPNAGNGALYYSHVSSHDVHLVERLCAVWTLPHAVGNAILNAVVAEQVAAGLQDGVFKVFPAYSTQGKGLRMLA